MIIKGELVGFSNVRTITKSGKDYDIQRLYISLPDKYVSGLKVLPYLWFRPTPVALGDTFVCSLNKYGDIIESITPVEDIL